MKIATCIDPGLGGTITKGKVYKVINSFTGIGGRKFITVINDFGEKQDYYKKRFNLSDEISDIIYKIREIKARREKLGYRY